MWMWRLAAACSFSVFASSLAIADPVALERFVDALEKKDAAACADTFHPDAKFIDLGNDFSDRIDWFCNAVIDGNGAYKIISTRSEGQTTFWDMEYSAGSYFLRGRGRLLGRNGRIVELTIEYR